MIDHDEADSYMYLLHDDFVPTIYYGRAVSLTLINQIAYSIDLSESQQVLLHFD